MLSSMTDNPIDIIGYLGFGLLQLFTCVSWVCNIKLELVNRDPCIELKAKAQC